MKEHFEDRRFTGSISIYLDEAKGSWETAKASICNHIISVCEEYLGNGDTLTLRQLYYQLVSKDLIPNHIKVYKKISKLKDDLVYAGVIDWDTFEDRGRVPSRAYFEHNVAGALKRTADWYKLNRQKNQPIHIEVWTEKDAISGILKQVTEPYTVSLVVNKGYNSSTAMYNAYERFVQAIENGKRIKILYFGDHDPSGLDMIRDIKDRLELMFKKGDQLTDLAERHYEHSDYTLDDIYRLGEPYDYMQPDDGDGKWLTLFEQGKIQLFLQDKELFDIQQIGLTMEQIKQYNPPHNPAKLTDPRAKWYIAKFGAVSWEVDALSPTVMREIVRDSIQDNMDLSVYENLKHRENKDQKEIRNLIKSLS